MTAQQEPLENVNIVIDKRILPASFLRDVFLIIIQFQYSQQNKEQQLNDLNKELKKKLQNN